MRYSIGVCFHPSVLPTTLTLFVVWPVVILVHFGLTFRLVVRLALSCFVVIRTIFQCGQDPPDREHLRQVFLFSGKTPHNCQNQLHRHHFDRAALRPGLNPPDGHLGKETADGENQNLARSLPANLDPGGRPHPAWRFLHCCWLA